MSTIYLLVDSSTNIIQYASYTVPQAVSAGQNMDGVDDTATNAQAALQRPSDYTYQNGQIVRRPYFTLAYGAGVLTATLNLAPATLPSVTFIVAGKTYTATPTTDGKGITTATLALQVHPSITQGTVNAGVSAGGFVSNSINIGGNGSQTTIQAYTDANSIAHVTPTSKAYLAEYWSSTVSPSYQGADIATSDSLLMDTVFNVILQALTGGTTPLVTLTANQQSTYSDMKTNVLPALVTTLDEAISKSDVHYQQYSADMKATKTALNNYASDLLNIPNLL